PFGNGSGEAARSGARAVRSSNRGGTRRSSRLPSIAPRLPSERGGSRSSPLGDAGGLRHAPRCGRRRPALCGSAEGRNPAAFPGAGAFRGELRCLPVRLPNTSYGAVAALSSVMLAVLCRAWIRFGGLGFFLEPGDGPVRFFDRARDGKNQDELSASKQVHDLAIRPAPENAG